MDWRKNKIVVMGMAERNGDVMFKIVDNNRRESVMSQIQEDIIVGTEIHVDFQPLRNVALTASIHPNSSDATSTINTAKTEKTKRMTLTSGLEMFFITFHFAMGPIGRFVRRIPLRWNIVGTSMIGYFP